MQNIIKIIFFKGYERIRIGYTQLLAPTATDPKTEADMSRGRGWRDVNEASETETGGSGMRWAPCGHRPREARAVSEEPAARDRS